MKETLRKLTERYAQALRRYLEQGGGEAALLDAYDVGRGAVAAKFSVLEMSAMHQAALMETLLARLPAEERAKVAQMASDFSAESLLPFELTARGAREQNAVLHQINETLEAKSAEISRQLAELVSLTTLKDDLLSLIVHDLRNPLAGMMSCVELLMPAPGDANYESTREIVHLAREGARKLNELIEDLLEVKKLEEGKVPIHAEAVSLAEIVREAIATLGPAARLDSIEVHFEASGPVELSVDRRLFRRLAENLISNALKFSRPKDTVNVTLAGRDGSVVLEVSDRGPGIAAELRDRLFQKFGNLDARSAGARRGYGLGLYFVKLVATAHGGSVAAEPRDGGGTTFRVHLPPRREG